MVVAKAARCHHVQLQKVVMVVDAVLGGVIVDTDGPKGLYDAVCRG